MKKILIAFVVLLQSSALLAQLPPHLEGRIEYPVFDFHPWVGVVKTKTRILKYDKDLTYKIAVDVTDDVRDSTEIMGTLLEVARTFNLNVANGVPKRKLDMAVVIHGSAIYGILNDEAYQKRFGVPNPNIAAIQTLKKQGIEMYVCAQVLAFRQVPLEDVMKDVDIAVSAKTALITLDQRGYSYMNVNEN